MDWYEEAKELRSQGITISKISQMLGISYKTVESRFARDKLRQGAAKVDVIAKPSEVDLSNLSMSILHDIQSQKKIEEICACHRITERVARATIDDLKDLGYQIYEDNSRVKINTDIVPQENRVPSMWKGDTVIRFGLMGDTQFNSKYTQITYLHNFYDVLKQEGIEDCYHTGDIDEGEEMRVGHKYECYTQGADDHVDEIVKNYPKHEGITTHFITGN